MSPKVIAFMRARAKQLGLSHATYVAILLRNYVEAPTTMTEREVDSPLKRARVQLSLSLQLRQKGHRASRALSGVGAFSRLIEALIIADAKRPSPALIVLPEKGTSKPRIGSP
jgi:hypothetical protein